MRVFAGSSGADGVVPGNLPLERLAVVARELALPGEHAEEMELDVRMRIDELLHEPRRRAAHGDAELLVQFARECRSRRFAGLELAARKLPVARVRLARGSLRERAPGHHAAG